MRIPARVQSDMERAYQLALSRGYAEVADDRVFYRALVEAGARWNILHPIHRVPAALSGDYQRGFTVAAYAKRLPSELKIGFPAAIAS